MFPIMRVLLVDDLPASSGPLTKALAGLRCDLIQARGTEEALRLLATDGVAGTPPEYGQLLLDNTLANLATRLTCAEIGDVWVPG